MKKWHLWLAASIGLVVIVGMMIREFDVEVLSRIDLSPRFFLGVVMGVLLFAVQNLMLTLRFRHLCQRKLSVAEAFRINVLCEFTSAVTPSAVGGSGLAFVYLNREGVSMGRSIFTMFAALLADEAFLAISCVLLYFCVPSHLVNHNAHYEFGALDVRSIHLLGSNRAASQECHQNKTKYLIHFFLQKYCNAFYRCKGI